MPAAIEEAFQRLEEVVCSFPRGDSLKKNRLERMKTLLRFFGNPHEGLQIIHVAGSKGKGSVSAFIAGQLSQLSLSVGLFTSPHVSFYWERITKAGKPFGEKCYLRNISLVKDSLSILPPPFKETPPILFEVLVVLAFLIFRETQCHWVVLETGIGGRLDATNVVIPVATVFTHIEKEHTELLGETLPAITREKSFIMKKGAPAFSARQSDQVLSVLRGRAREVGVPFFYLPELLLKSQLHLHPKSGKTELSLVWRDNNSLSTSLSLGGVAQSENAAVAATVVRHLFPEASLTQMASGLGQVVLPARSETVWRAPFVLLDSAHTRNSVKALLKTVQLKRLSEAILIFGCLESKDTTSMVEILSGHFSNVIITRPGFFKKSDVESVFKAFLKHQPEGVEMVGDPREALLCALRKAQRGRPIVVGGSLYLAGEIRRYFISLGPTASYEDLLQSLKGV